MTTLTLRQQVEFAHDNAPAGFTKIGNGLFSTVYSHPDCPDIVVKISDRNIDRAYDQFARLAIKSRSKFLPRIYHHSTDPETGATRTILRRYERLSNYDIVSEISTSADRLRLHRPVPFHFRLRNILARIARIPNVSFDLHHGNIMWDPATSTPILTDPVFS